MSGITLSALAAVQALGQGQRLDLIQTFKDSGFMMWPLAFFAAAGARWQKCARSRRVELRVCRRHIDFPA